MPADATKGRRRAIAERIFTWLDDCLSSNDYYEYILSMDKKFPVARSKIMPVITISLGEHRLESLEYGRLTPEKGMTAYYPFTMFIYHRKTDDPDLSHNYDVHILSDLIVKYLRTRQANSGERSLSDVYRVTDVNTRESDPLGSRRLTRMILNGTVVAKRRDSP